MLSIWQRLAAALLGWQYARVCLNRGKSSEHWTVFRIHAPSSGPRVFRVWTVKFSPDTFVNGQRAVESQVQSWERLSDYDYTPLTPGL